MIEMEKDVFKSYFDTLKKAIISFSRKKETEKNALKIINIFKAFEVYISREEITSLSEMEYYELDDFLVQILLRQVTII